MASAHYHQSVEIGREFQKNNLKNWTGADSKNYHNQIRYLMDKYDARTVLDYGCGKGYQYTQLLEYGIDDGVGSEPMTFQTRINAESVYKYDPCVPEFEELPPTGSKFDAVICTQVLGSIPDADVEMVARRLAAFATKFVFIGLHAPATPPKTKKQMYDPAYLSVNRSVSWYIDRFHYWNGPPLYWWFRDTATSYNDWYPNR